MPPSSRPTRSSISQGRGRFGFLEKTLLGDLVAGQVRWQQFDGNRPIQPGITGLIDDAHAACAELAGDAVGPELSAGG